MIAPTVLLLLIIYLAIWISANLKSNSKIKVNESTIEVKVGDIFSQPELKVITFNEYFDSIVDEELISSSSINGEYINRKIDDIDKFDKMIEEDSHLRSKSIEVNKDRERGKKIKYQLGSSIVNNNFILTAFAKFNNNDEAYLSVQDYVSFLLNLWSEIDRVYSGRSISIPLVGSGITRIKDHIEISDQELLNIIIWTFKISRMKITHPAKVSIIISEGKKDNINFYKIGR